MNKESMEINKQLNIMNKSVKKNKVQLDIEHPEKISSYFKREFTLLLVVTVCGLIYNVGLGAEPFFEGQLAQMLFEIIKGKSTFIQMVILATKYVLVILFVQGARYIKRLFTRRFSNNTIRNMRHMLYNHLVHLRKTEIEQESVGTLMTKAVADVDACAEGMRKFTTEIFDTGVALITYLVIMIFYDWRLTLLSCMFIPLAYLIAEKMKVYIYRYNSIYKKSASQLNDATMERVLGAVTYRVTGREENRNKNFEWQLSKYEKTAIMANVWENSLTPIYNIISITGVMFILYFGGKNVLGTGYRSWNIAAFTAFLSCFVKMAKKSSKAAKLVNAVQKAQVSWKRIKPLMQKYVETDSSKKMLIGDNVELNINNLSFSYDKKRFVFGGLSINAMPGDIIGVTGPVACGKSSFGKAFLQEYPYEGSIKINGRELRDFSDSERNHLISYLGHYSELFSDTIENNIRFGEDGEILVFLKSVCLDKEVMSMPEAEKTEIGAGGVRLSGGQQARLALARTLYHKKKIIILDDPFSAVDSDTENQIMDNIRKMVPDAIIFIMSHRVTMFSKFNQVIWMEGGKVRVGSHTSIIKEEKKYARIYKAQKAGGDLDEDA